MVAAADPPARAAPARRRWGRLADRSLRPGEARRRRPGALAAGRSADLDPSPLVRPARAAPDSGGGRGLRGRPRPRRLRAAGRPPARLAPLRRADGEAVDGRRPLRREQRLRARRAPPERLAIPRLAGPCLQRRPALHRLRPAPDRRRRAPAGRPRGDRRHRLPRRRGVRHRRPEPAERCDARRRPPGRAGGPRRHHLPGLPRPDRPLRPLPRPQVRPDPPGRLLPARLGPRRRPARRARRHPPGPAGRPPRPDGRRTPPPGRAATGALGARRSDPPRHPGGTRRVRADRPRGPRTDRPLGLHPARPRVADRTPRRRHAWSPTGSTWTGRPAMP